MNAKKIYLCMLFFFTVVVCVVAQNPHEGADQFEKDAKDLYDKIRDPVVRDFFIDLNRREKIEREPKQSEQIQRESNSNRESSTYETPIVNPIDILSYEIQKEIRERIEWENKWNSFETKRAKKNETQIIKDRNDFKPVVHLNTVSSIQDTKSSFKPMNAVNTGENVKNKSTSQGDFSQAKGGYDVMKILGEKKGLNFSDYISKERWEQANNAEKAKTMSNEELFQWHADYNRFLKDLYGSDPVLNVIEDFSNELKTELKELGINVATVLISAGVTATTGVFLKPANATIVKATTESIASIAKDINRDNSIDFQKALASGANVFVGSAIKDNYGKVTYNVYIVGKTIYNEKGINKKMATETTKIIAEKLGIEKGNKLPIDVVLKYIKD